MKRRLDVLHQFLPLDWGRDVAGGPYDLEALRLPLLEAFLKLCFIPGTGIDCCPELS